MRLPCLLLCLLAVPAMADDGLQVPAVVVSTWDADTWNVDAFPWPNDTKRVKIRVRGADAPEIAGSCLAERELAMKGRHFSEAFIGAAVLLREIGEVAIYGRTPANITLPDGRDLATVLFDNGLARPCRNPKCEREPPGSWCPVPVPSERPR